MSTKQLCEEVGGLAALINYRLDRLSSLLVSSHDRLAYYENERELLHSKDYINSAGLVKVDIKDRLITEIISLVKEMNQWHVTSPKALSENPYEAHLSLEVEKLEFALRDLDKIKMINPNDTLEYIENGLNFIYYELEKSEAVHEQIRVSVGGSQLSKVVSAKVGGLKLLADMMMYF